MPKYNLITLGCKVNEYESSFYEESLQKAGFEKAQENADVIIVNSCTVTNKAAAKSRQMISRLKKKNPDALVTLVGCYATLMSSGEREKLGIELLIREKTKLVEEIEKAIESKKQNVDSVSTGQPEDKSVNPVFEAMPVSHFAEQHRAFLKIQDGCNQFCAYCQIPYARGRERSWTVDKIIESASRLRDQNHLEIVLTGIHTGRFHDEDTDLAGLLQELLEKTPEDLHFRISSIEINEVSDDLIRLMKENPRIEPHLHIPIQSGNDETLKRMRRPYTVEEFEQRVNKIRREVPKVSISTDIIAGFVGESDEEFEDTLKNLERIGFSFLHVFGYSRREGTLADKMEGHLDPRIIKERVSRLLQLSRNLRAEDMKRFDRSVMLVERKDDQGFFHGYTSQYHPVKVKAEHLEGRVPVRLVSSQGGEYTGEAADETL